MMRLRNFVTTIIAIAASLIALSCSESGLGDFQANFGYEYKMFDLLDDYPSLYDLVNHLDQQTVNLHLGDVVNERIDEYIVNSRDTNRLIGHSERPVQKTLQKVRNMLNRIINQDTADYQTPDPETNYANDLFQFIDTARGLDLDLTGDILSIARKTSQYELDSHDAATVKSLLLDNIDLMLDNDLKDELDSNFETIGKLLLQADYNIWLAGGPEGALRENRDDIDPGSDYNTGLGNSVQGVNALLMALNSIAKDENVRDDLYDVIREVGNVFGSHLDTAGGEKGPKEIFKNIIETAEDYFTRDGAQNAKTESELGLSGLSNLVYGGTGSDTSTYYSNSELQRLLLSMQVGNLGLLARADRPESLISTVDPTKNITDPDYNSPSNKNYVLDRLIKNLKYIEFDPDAANIEETIYDLIRFDTYGRDRKEPGAYATSYLEQFLFLSAASQASGWDDGGNNGERTSTADPSREHGHGTSVEFVSFNDSLFAMGGSETLGLNTYELAFGNNYSTIFRNNKQGFDRGGSGNYQFGYNQNWSAQKFMSGACQGDVGTPGGGNPNGGAYNGQFNTYSPFTADGFGDTNMSRYTLYWMVRGCWNGEGPYYYDPSKADKTVDTIQFDTTSIESVVEVFQHPNYSGYSAKLAPGNYSLAQLRSYGVQNDDLSSIKVPAGMTVTVFVDDNFSSTHTSFSANTSTLNSTYNENISAIQVTGSATAAGNKTFNVYYRPNGQVYMLKSVNAPYIYVYPADGDDQEVNWNSDGSANISAYYTVKGISGRTKERWNRYRQKWYSDFYLIQCNSGTFEFWISPTKGDGTLFGLLHLGSGTGATEAGRFMFNEMIAEDNANRACASQEEAIFRNYQWVMTEKKYSIVVPLSLHALGIGNGGGFQIVEGNGIAGLTACRKYRSTENTWAIANGDTTKLTPLGDSLIPGDYRISVYFAGDDIVSPDTVWNSIFTGTANPPLVTHNAPGVFRFGFPRYYFGDRASSSDDVSPALGSRVPVSGEPDNYGFTVGDAKWNQRNTLLPLIITMLGTVLDNQNRNFSEPANCETTLSRLKKFTETMMLPILSRFYYRYDTTSPDPNTTKGTWVPRINGTGPSDTTAHHVRIHRRTYEVSGRDGDAPDSCYWGGWAQRNYYQPIAMRTPLNMLYDSDYSTTDGRCDGLLALLTEYDVTQPRGTGNAPKSRLITNALKLLMNLGDAKFDDPTGLDYSAANFDDTYPQWGARRKLLYALEQVVSSMKFTKSKVVDILGRAPKNISYPAWMFTAGTDSDSDGHCDTFTGTRDVDVIVDKSLHSLVGHNKTATLSNTGLAAYPDERDPGDPNYEGKSWNLFNDTLGRLGELLSSKGTTAGKYNIMEDVISIVDKSLAKVNPTDGQIRALVHTLGIIATYYDGGWIYPDDVKLIVTEYLPLILEAQANNPDYTNGENMRMGALISNDFLRPGGLADYVANTMETDYSAREIFDDIFRFLGDPLIANPDSRLWDDIVEMNEGMIDAMIRCQGKSGWELYNELDYQYNGPNGEVTFDYFGNVGRVLSR